MKEHTADELRYFSNFDRGRDFMDKLLRKAARLRGIGSTWPDVGCSPKDAAYRKL
jgi:hypothetical protein